MKTITIYALTHKEFVKPDNDIYVPLFVGSALHSKDALPAYIKDNTGDNISAKNIYYSELTGHYWIWHNDTVSDIVGTCHYRRYLMDDNNHLLDRAQIESLLSKYDVITTKRVHLNNSYYYGFTANHNAQALDTTGEVIRDFYPEDYDTYLRMVNDDYTHFSNMLITRKELFDEYCKWLFSIFSEVENRINLDTDEDSYHKRVLGFISEFLLGVWLNCRGYTSKECKVAVMCEKKEVTEVKAELAGYFARKDISGAKEYFMNAISLRPDLMHEAADITGELHIAMQIISTCEHELSNDEECTIERINDFGQLIAYFSHLNDCIVNDTTVDGSYSKSAIYVARSIYGKL